MADPLTSISPVVPLLNRRPLGLFSDIDGTLAPIVPRPEDAKVTPRCRRLLKSLIKEGVKVGLITGRPLAKAREMADVPGVAIAANHGLEVWVKGRNRTPDTVEAYASAARKILEETSALAFDGLVMEHKGPVLAFHYRQANDEVSARRMILEALHSAETARIFSVHEGRKVVELRPPLAVNKGTALVEVASELGCGSLICLGDDNTDVDMFDAARTLDAKGTPSLAVAVTSDETSPLLLESADYNVNGVSGVEWFLGELLSAVRSRSA
jgi:trehalose 6-phosphate phosphatase